MVNNLKICFEGDGIIDIRDNQGFLKNLRCGGEATFKGKIELPNKIRFDLTVDTSIKIKELWLGSIKASNNMLDQICKFSDSKGKHIFTTFWDSSGSVLIDFFSPDFIQYHLTYGNKFNSR